MSIRRARDAKRFRLSLSPPPSLRPPLSLHLSFLSLSPSLPPPSPSQPLSMSMYNLLLKTKAKARDMSYKYVWHRRGKIFIRKDNGNPLMQITTGADLENLKLLPVSNNYCKASTTVTSVSNIEIAYSNANSLLAHLEQVEAFIYDKSFHLISITETWLHSHVSDDLMHIPNYYLIRSDREGKEDGGVACYVHESLKA